MSEMAKMMKYDAKKKSLGVAYLLWVFLGWFGAHRFYAGATGTGAVYLVLQVISWLTFLQGLGMMLSIAIGIWWLIDAFLLPGLISRANLQLAAEIQAE